MRFMVIVKASEESESGALPSEEILAEMGRFNEELVKAGVMNPRGPDPRVGGEGLHPSSKGARVRFGGRTTTVVDGPFPETKELVAGFWIWNVKSKQEAIDWVKRAPFREGEVEIRQVYEVEEFAASDPTGKIRESENRLREKIASRS